MLNLLRINSPSQRGPRLRRPLKTVFRAHGIRALGMGLILVALTACSDDKSPGISAIYVLPTAQERLLTLDGVGFGEDMGQVFISGVCGDIAEWTDSRLVFEIPTGVGVGHRQGVLVLSDGKQIHFALEIVGRNLPLSTEPRPCVLAQRSIAELDSVVMADAMAIDGTEDAESEPDLAPKQDLDNTPDAPTPDMSGVPDQGGSVDAGLADVPPSTEGYRYLRLLDISGVALGRNPGADIDGIEIQHADGVRSFARSVVTYRAEPFNVDQSDPNEALGVPDAFPGFPDDLTTCDVRNNSVALGGAGELVLELERPVLTSELVTVYEVGDCTFDGSRSAIQESYIILVAKEPVGPWLEVGVSNTSPKYSAFVPPE